MHCSEGSPIKGGALEHASDGEDRCTHTHGTHTHTHSHTWHTYTRAHTHIRTDNRKPYKARPNAQTQTIHHRSPFIFAFQRGKTTSFKFKDPSAPQEPGSSSAHNPLGAVLK